MLIQTVGRFREKGPCQEGIQVARRSPLLEDNKPDMCRMAVRHIRFSRTSKTFISLPELSKMVFPTWEEDLASLSFTSSQTSRNFMPR